MKKVDLYLKVNNQLFSSIFPHIDVLHVKLIVQHSIALSTTFYFS